MSTIFTPEQFGAVADGRHDDAKAIGQAVREAVACGGTVRFQSHATYLVVEADKEGVGPACLNLNSAKGVTVEGEDTTLVAGKNMPYFNVNGCTDTTIRGFNFELRPHTAFRGRLVSVSREKVSAVITTDEPVPLADKSYRYYDYTNAKAGAYAFAMPDDTFRNHLFLKQINHIGPGNTYEVWFTYDRPTRDALRIVAEKRCDIILPTPGMSHAGVAFHVLGSRNIHIEHCDIREGAQFMGAIKGNTGDLWFDHVLMCAKDDGDQPMVGWRDGYHCKDNQGAQHWKDCVIGRLYDDAFNISCTLLLVSQQDSADQICLKNMEINGAYYGVQAGNVLSLYNTFTGEIISEGNRVTEVVRQHGADLCVRLEKPLPELDLEHTRVAFESHSSPGSTVENCLVKGTVRFRGPITCTDTVFDLSMMWTENETWIEGPVPRDMLFENCAFNGHYPVSGRYLENYFSFRTVMAWPGVAQYKLKNIRLKNCRLDSRYTYVEEGNDVRFENCTENENGRPIPERL